MTHRTGLFLATLVLAVGPVAAARAADEALAGAAKKAAADSYAFTVDEKPGPGTGGATEARYQKGRPLWVKADGIEFFKEGDVVVYKQGEQWMRSRRGTESDPLRVLGGLAKVNAVRLPHEELADLAAALRDVKKTDAGGGLTQYAGELTEEAARKLVRTEHRNVARGGTGRVWVAAGEPVKYAFTVRLQGRVGNAEIDGSATKTVTLAGIGKTEVAVPEAARKALGERPGG
jgi:hypothetical protein